jgi:hypothetical protein
MRIAITLATLVALGSSAHAGGGDIGVVVTGEGSMQSQLAAQIEDWLSHHGHTLVQTPLPSDAIPLLDDCFVMMDPKACARRIIEKRAKSPSMVYAHLKTTNNTSSGARDVTLTAFWFDAGREALSESTTCESCTDQLLRTTADEVMRKLASSLVGHVKLRSTPDTARISIDGQPPIGVTPLNLDLPPGKHTITMTKQGFEPVTRNIVVVSDKTETIATELRAPPDQDTGGKPSRLLPIAVMAAGGALVATGVVLIAIDQDKVPEEPKRIYDTARYGVGLAIGGAAIVGVGTYLLLRSPTTTSAPVASLTSDTAYIGWAGRF